MTENRYYLPALRGRFGDWAFYATLMPLAQIRKRISFAKEIHKNRRLSELIQRKLTSDRADEIASHLLRNEDRFFNSIVVAIYGGDPIWHEIGVTVNDDSIDVEDFDDTALYSLGYLSLTEGESIFALDGQHRLAGIRRALRTKPELADEELSVIFVAHHLTEAGRRRTRKLFTTLNRYAKAVKKSEVIALDESDIMANATRHRVENHRFFNKEQVDVLSPNANLRRGDLTHWTTIVNIYEVLEIVFPYVKNRMTMEETPALKLYRLSDEQIEEYNEFAETYFEDLAGHVPALNAYFAMRSAAGRMRVIRRNRGEVGGHVLFRPVGVKIFAQIVARLRATASFAAPMETLAKLPTGLDQEPYAGTIWNPHRRTMQIGRAAVCRDVLLYMLGKVGGRAAQLQTRYARSLERDVDEVRLPGKVI